MYKTINGWTKKSMVEHIKKEFKGKSVNVAGTCLYRGPDGKKCAIGMFIPDELYSTDMESFACTAEGKFDNVLDKMPLIMSQLGGWAPEGVTPLQNIHDDSDPNGTLNDILDWIDKNVEA